MVNKSLKALRESSGQTQGELSKLTGINIPTLSNIESGNVLPMLEDIIILQKVLKQQIGFSDNIADETKTEIMNNLVSLSQYYPITAVINFAVRGLQQGVKLGDPGCMIRHYATVSKGMEPMEFMFPDDVEEE